MNRMVHAKGEVDSKLEYHDNLKIYVIECSYKKVITHFDSGSPILANKGFFQNPLIYT